MNIAPFQRASMVSRGTTIFFPEVSCVADKDDGNEESQEQRFIQTLKEDLQALEYSWRNKSLSAEKIANLYDEILHSFSDVVRTEDFEDFEHTCEDLEDYIASVKGRKTELADEAWRLTAELMDLFCSAMREGSAPAEKLKQLRSRIAKQVTSKLSAKRKYSEEHGRTDAISVTAGGNQEIRAQEETTMTDHAQQDPKLLLAEAQEALSSGKGYNAKELALKAAELIAQVEAEEARKKLAALQIELENVAHEESEAQAFLDETRERATELEKEYSAFNQRLTDARANFNNREKECEDLKKEIEKTEAEMASLKERQKELRERFEEVVPARDAAKRECARIENESKDLPSEVQTWRDSLKETEERLAEIRNRKSVIEAELKELAEKNSE
jgi:predicted  nucleic acid-binding Zn-ribbon protein